MYLRDRFQAHRTAPGVRALQRGGFLIGPVCCYGGGRNWQAGVSVSWASHSRWAGEDAGSSIAVENVLAL